MIKAAIHGMGRWGARLVDSVQGKSNKITFVTGVARSAEKYAAFGAERGIRITEDYGAVLADPGIDAVVLATPPTVHAEQVIAAAKAGKHVFVEKPFTFAKTDAEAMARACADAGVVLAVGFNRRFLPAYQEMRRLIAAGKIGQILHIEAHFSGPTGLRLTPDTWRATRAANPAGGMVARGVHALDMAISLAGDVASVYVLSDRRVVAVDMDDTTSMAIRFASGATAGLATILATGEFWRFHVFGSAGWIEMHGAHDLTIGDLDGRTEQRHFEKTDLERAELEAFADAVTGGAPFPVRVDDAVLGSAAFEAIARSAETGAAVRVG